MSIPHPYVDILAELASPIVTRCGGMFVGGVRC